MANRFSLEALSRYLPEAVTSRLDRRDGKHRGTHITPDTELLDRKKERTVSNFLATVNKVAAAEILTLMGAEPDYWREHEGATAAAVIEAVSRATERGIINHNIVGVTKAFVAEQVAIQLQLFKVRQRLAGQGSIQDALSANRHLIGTDDTHAGLISSQQIAIADSAFVNHDVAITRQDEAALYKRSVNVYMSEVFLGGAPAPREFQQLDTSAAVLFMAQMLRRSFERALWEGTIDEKVAFAQAHLLQQKGINPDQFLDSPGSFGMMTVFLANPFHGYRTESLGKLQLTMMRATRNVAELAYNRAVGMLLFPNSQTELSTSLLKTLKFYLDHGAFRTNSQQEAEEARLHISKVEQHISQVMLGTAGALIDYAVNTADQARNPLTLADRVGKYSQREIKVATNAWADGIARHIVKGDTNPQLVILP
jgi:hypothetical protein